MSGYVIRHTDPARTRSLGGPNIPEGAWLRAFDPEFAGGLGRVDWTMDPTKAMVFEDAGKAMECYRTVSVTIPTRDDGRPNRPLTAFSVLIEPAP